MRVRLELRSEILFERGIVSTTDDYEICDSLARILDAVDLVIAIFDRLLVLNPDWIPKL